MSETKTFKAQKGKVLYCPSGDIVFTDGFYITDNEDEIACIERGIGIEDITGTDEAKEASSGRKRPVISKEDKEKNRKAKEEKEAKKAEKEKAEKTEKPKAPEGGTADENKKQDGDVALEDMTVEQLKEYLDAREVGYADDLAEDDLRNLVHAEAEKELHGANGDSDVEDLGKDEDIEVMPKPRCQELLKKAGVAFKNNDGVAVLRKLVEKL